MSTRLNKPARGPIDHTCTSLKKRYKKVIPLTCLIATTVPMQLLPIDFMHVKRSSAVGGVDMSIVVGWGTSFDHHFT